MFNRELLILTIVIGYIVSLPFLMILGIIIYPILAAAWIHDYLIEN